MASIKDCDLFEQLNEGADPAAGLDLLATLPPYRLNEEHRWCRAAHVYEEMRSGTGSPSTDVLSHTPAEGKSLELEAIAAVRELSFALRSISVSTVLPRASDLIFVNITTLEGDPYCVELTIKGWRISSVRQDCMNGDFRLATLHARYFDTMYALLDQVSPMYRQKFGQRLADRLGQGPGLPSGR